jgi:DNA-binding ferritin-like protein
MTKNKLCYLIADNYIAAYKAQVYHFNVTGSNFPQYHALFGKVYEKLSAWHDTFVELLRQDGEKYSFNLKDLINESAIPDDAFDKNVPGMLGSVCSDLNVLLGSAEKLYATADPALETELGTYCTVIKKLAWKIDATIGK